MNTSKLVLPVLTLFVFVNSTFGQDAKPEPTNLGASLSGPFYRRGDHEPFAGFVVDVRTLQMAVSKSLKGDVTVEQLRKLLDPTKLQAAMDPKNEASVQTPMWVMRRDLPIRTRPYYWSSFNKNSGKITIVFYNRMEDLDSPQPFEERGLQSFEAAKQSVNQVEKLEVQNLTAEQESFIEAKKVDGYAPEQRYQLGFRLEAYAEKILGEGSFVAPGREVIWQENLVDETEVERSNLRLEGTRTFDFSSNLTKKESPLVAYRSIYYNFDAKKKLFQDKNAKMAVGEFAYTDKVVRLGVISDMAQRLLGADDLSLKFSGTVSDERLDARSLLSLKLEGATRKLALGNTIGIGGLEVRSSQSFMRTEFLLNSAWRWNDIRGYRPEKYPSKFVTLDKCGASMTFDLGLETGWTIYGNVKHARLTKFPDDDLPERFVFRPLARLNFTKDRILGDSVALSGNITGWYVNRGWSGLDIGSTFAERAELSLVYEGNGFEVGFSVTAGRNPISNFDRIAPEYGLKIQFK